jgi:hypothetical protein
MTVWRSQHTEREREAGKDNKKKKKKRKRKRKRKRTRKRDERDERDERDDEQRKNKKSWKWATRPLGMLFFYVTKETKPILIKNMVYQHRSIRKVPCHQRYNHLLGNILRPGAKDIPIGRVMSLKEY